MEAEHVPNIADCAHNTGIRLHFYLQTFAKLLQGRTSPRPHSGMLTT